MNTNLFLKNRKIISKISRKIYFINLMVLESVKSIQGKRDYMEDRYSYVDQDGIIIAFICDGHGGDQVAETVKHILPEILFHRVKTFKPHYSNVIKAKLIRKTLLYLGQNMYNSVYSSGSTLTGIVADKNTVFIFNIGDSRTCFKTFNGVYSLTPIFLNGQYQDEIKVDILNFKNTNLFCTRDHDAHNEIEVKRIKESGGKIIDDRLNGVLSVTRTVGDFDIKPGLSYVPDVFWIEKNNVAGPIVMYSDGIYEPERITAASGTIGGPNFDKKTLYHIGSTYGANGLVSYAYLNGSEDNLTCLVVTI